MTLIYWILGVGAAWLLCYGVFLLALVMPVWVLGMTEQREGEAHAV